MIHYLQCLWWEWRWRMLRNHARHILVVLPFEESRTTRFDLAEKLWALERDMAALEQKMRVRP